MRANVRRDTAPELRLRSALHRAGVRYRVDFPIRPPGSRPIRPDIVFTARRIAVFVDGCFWHGCPLHATTPTTNRAYWEPKLAANRERDLRTRAALESDGWIVLRFWEHEDSREAAQKVLKVVRNL
jgi:DNA mismatch endonuclease (patch repair protein)